MINKITQMDNLDSNHDHAIDQDNERRLTGVNETSSIHDFSAGVANRSPDGEKTLVIRRYEHDLDIGWDFREAYKVCISKTCAGNSFLWLVWELKLSAPNPPGR